MPIKPTTSPTPPVQEAAAHYIRMVHKGMGREEWTALVSSSRASLSSLSAIDCVRFFLLLSSCPDED